ncbi:MAG TPA: sugar ABC transporter permease [Stellaceae bacterium]|nr:sugar ABC transporter permease [Stellaceae bacterium]
MPDGSGLPEGIVLSSAARAMRRVEARAAWGLAAPTLVLMAILLVLPTIAVLLLSLTDWELGAAHLGFVGFDNYVELAHDRTFVTSLRNTLIFAAIVTPVSVVLGLGAALLIEAEPIGKTFFRTAYFMPVVSLIVAMATVWQYLLHPTIGPLNALLRLAGMGGPNWLGSSDTVLVSLAIIGVWQAVGFNMVLFLAGLTAIPRDLYAAAEVDGVKTGWDRFWTVTWPLLAPTTLFVVTITLIQAVKVFETVATLTQGGPSKASEVLLWTIYQEGFVYLHVGYASAMTIVFVAILMVVTLLQTRVLERRVHY